MIFTVVAGLFILLAMFTVLRDDPECAVCGFRKSAHKNKNKQWHPDYSPCDNFKEKICT
tara:strand:+ start:447 stop:623 length:177 start_codon:yes stop_codon:yes gene_type:complete